MTPEQQRQYLKHMGVPVWVRRHQPEPEAVAPEVIREVQAEVPVAVEAAPPAVPPSTSTDLDWPALQTAVAGCHACGLHQYRSNTVFGVGDPSARWMIVGEGPGADEDQQGEPFVGRAGQLLNAMIKACGAERAQVYIANVVKCRPPENRNPLPQEVASCIGYLQRQIELVQPQLILAVGKVAAQTLLQSEEPIGRLRGQVYQYGEQAIPLVVTYHPAYLLRKPTEKAKAWDDLKQALRIITPL